MNASPSTPAQGRARSLTRLYHTARFRPGEPQNGTRRVPPDPFGYATCAGEAFRRCRIRGRTALDTMPSKRPGAGKRHSREFPFVRRKPSNHPRDATNAMSAASCQRPHHIASKDQPPWRSKDRLPLNRFDPGRGQSVGNLVARLKRFLDPAKLVGLRWPVPDNSRNSTPALRVAYRPGRQQEGWRTEVSSS